MEAVIISSLVASALSVIASVWITRQWFPKVLIKEVILGDDELPVRGEGHVHDFHIAGREKGLIKYECSNDVCSEIRLVKPGVKRGS
jgi:hypothetical protein